MADIGKMQRQDKVTSNKIAKLEKACLAVQHALWALTSDGNFTAAMISASRDREYDVDRDALQKLNELTKDGSRGAGDAARMIAFGRYRKR